MLTILAGALLEKQIVVLCSSLVWIIYDINHVFIYPVLTLKPRYLLPWPLGLVASIVLECLIIRLYFAELQIFFFHFGGTNVDIIF